LRYTPAGVPIVSATLLHSSQQVEAGVARLVEFEMPRVRRGEISGRFSQAEMGAAYQFTGFLAKKKPQQQKPGVSHH
jgi:primosomal replication protein N